jgi:hypothetical protein
MQCSNKKTKGKEKSAPRTEKRKELKRVIIRSSTEESSDAENAKEKEIPKKQGAKKNTAPRKTVTVKDSGNKKCTSEKNNRAPGKAVTVKDNDNKNRTSERNESKQSPKRKKEDSNDEELPSTSKKRLKQECAKSVSPYKLFEPNESYEREVNELVQLLDSWRTPEAILKIVKGKYM